MKHSGKISKARMKRTRAPSFAAAISRHVGETMQVA